jgi:putative PIN family toxin of toxin-antitoxin system
MPGDERLVLDTNVVLSGLLFPDSIPSRALLKAQSCTVLASEATCLELAEVMGRSRFDRYIEREVRRQIADAYARACEPVEIPFPIYACRDPKDDKFLEVAVHGRADLIVTGDRDLLDLHPFHEILILTPAQYLERQ